MQKCSEAWKSLIESISQSDAQQHEEKLLQRGGSFCFKMITEVPEGSSSEEIYRKLEQAFKSLEAKVENLKSRPTQSQLTEAQQSSSTYKAVAASAIPVTGVGLGIAGVLFAAPIKAFFSKLFV